MNKQDLEEILASHKRWLDGSSSGSKADLWGAKLSHFLIVPEEGSFIAWKACAGGVVLKLRIPKEAKRMNSLVGRKIRVSEAEVVAAYRRDGTEYNDGTQHQGWYKSSFLYIVGETAVPDKYDDDIRVECTSGIHCFLTRREAEEWN